MRHEQEGQCANDISLLLFKLLYFLAYKLAADDNNRYKLKMGEKQNTGPLLATMGLSFCIGPSAPGSVCVTALS